MSDHVRVPGENRPVDRLLLGPTPRLPTEEDEDATLEQENAQFWKDWYHGGKSGKGWQS